MKLVGRAKIIPLTTCCETCYGISIDAEGIPVGSMPSDKFILMTFRDEHPPSERGENNKHFISLCKLLNEWAGKEVVE